MAQSKRGVSRDMIFFSLSGEMIQWFGVSLLRKGWERDGPVQDRVRVKGHFVSPDVVGVC